MWHGTQSQKRSCALLNLEILAVYSLHGWKASPVQNKGLKLGLGYFGKHATATCMADIQLVSYTGVRHQNLNPQPSDPDCFLSPGALQLESFPRCKTQVTQFGDEETGANNFFCHKLLSCCIGSSIVAKKSFFLFPILFSEHIHVFGSGKGRVAPHCPFSSPLSVAMRWLPAFHGVSFMW